MLPGSRFSLESAAQVVRRRLLPSPRAARPARPEWPRSRGPTPNPRRP
jgi:hypothetical protein